MNKKDYSDIQQKIADEVLKRHGRTLTPGGYVDGTHVGLQFVEEIRGGRANSWSYSRNGKVQVRVGKEAHWVTGENSVGFKQLKAGGHNYEKIADKLVEMADYVIKVRARRKRDEEKKNDHREFIKSMEKKYNTFSYGSGLEVGQHSNSLRFKVTVKTHEQAEKMLALAVELGLVTSKEMTTINP